MGRRTCSELWVEIGRPLSPKIQAGVLIVDIKEGERSRRLAFEFVDELVVMHAMDEPWQRTLVMRHQRDIVVVVTAELAEVVGVV